jgi:hypothetical protein
MSADVYLKKQQPERQEILTEMHQVILAADKTIEARVGPMMGKEMILYDAAGAFKYGLASVKNYMSLHVMPMYANPKLHARYAKLLDKAQFQKGCINFKDGKAMPLDIVRQLIEDCAPIDLRGIMDNLKKNPASKYF